MSHSTTLPVTAFLVHYVEYLTSSGILLTLLLLFAPLLYTKRGRSIRPSPIPGCKRAGLYRRSNLSNPEVQLTKDTAGPTVRAIYVYPIKSCCGVELAASKVKDTGLAYDRIFTFAHRVTDKDGQQHWRFITQREYPKLALLETQLWLPASAGRGRRQRPSQTDGFLTPRSRRDTVQLESASPRRGRPNLNRERGSSAADQVPPSLVFGTIKSKGPEWVKCGGCLIVRLPTTSLMARFGLARKNNEFRLPLVPTNSRAFEQKYSYEDISIWKDRPRAINMTSEIPRATLSELQAFLGVKDELAIFRVDEKHYRKVNRNLPQNAPEGTDFRVGLSDAFPVNLLNIASVQAVDSNLPAASNQKGTLSPLRFRANIFVEGVPAYDEDTWKRIHLGQCVRSVHQVQLEAGIEFKADQLDERNPTLDAMVVVEGEYHVACRTARCKLPNVNPETGEKDINEPYRTLRKTRDVDTGASPHPCLGMQMIPLFERGVVQVGDKIEVLEVGEHCYEKMFP